MASPQGLRRPIRMACPGDLARPLYAQDNRPTVQYLRRQHGRSPSQWLFWHRRASEQEGARLLRRPRNVELDAFGAQIFSSASTSSADEYVSPRMVSDRGWRQAPATRESSRPSPILLDGHGPHTHDDLMTCDEYNAATCCCSKLYERRSSNTLLRCRRCINIGWRHRR